MAERERQGYRLASWSGIPVAGKDRMVLCVNDNGLIVKYDYLVNDWVLDREMYSIFIGSPQVINITEKQAQRTIEANGGEWKPAPYKPTPSMR